MKKYLALALLTATGVSSLRAIQEPASSMGDYPTLNEAATYAGAARKSKFPRPQPPQLKLNGLAADRGVEAATVAAAVVAHAVAGALEDAQKRPEDFSVVIDDTSIITTEQLDGLEALTRTQIISKETLAELKKAQEISDAKNELLRQEEEAAAKLASLYRDTKAKRDSIKQTTQEKQARVVEYTASRDTKKQTLQEKQAQAAKDLEAKLAAIQAAKASARAATEAEQDFKQTDAFTLQRQNSVQRDLDKLALQEEQLAKIAGQLEAYGKNAADLDTELVDAVAVPPQESNFAWLTNFFSFGASKADSASDSSSQK